jgi:hypothetical protein
MPVISYISSFLFFSSFGGAGISKSSLFFGSFTYKNPYLGKQCSNPIPSSLMHLT